MKLRKVQITEFQSIRNTTEFIIEYDITCLVGKNEAGKTSILEALRRLNPIIGENGDFNVTDDYPRSDVEDYNLDVEEKKRTPAVVVKAIYIIEDFDLAEIVELFGEKALQTKEMTLEKSYLNRITVSLLIDNSEAIEYLLRKYSKSDLFDKLKIKTSTKELEEILDAAEQTEAVIAINKIVQRINKSSFSIGLYIYNNILKNRVPKFLYFDEYYQMEGCANIEALQIRQSSGNLFKSDHPLLGLINLARLDFDSLLNPNTTRQLKNKLEGAGNHLTKKIINYWSQNKHLTIKFDVRPAAPGDPDGMKAGTNIWGEIHDERRKVSTEIGKRSKGFVWFFSFLAWFSDIKRGKNPVILLLDEPGLFLHATAQNDLLKYFEAEVKDSHQLIYTTHSPFLVDPKKFGRVRIVEDKSIITSEELPLEEQGTKVLSDVLEASNESLFPLQSALGYEIHQSLFIGPYSLIVEGVSDLIYLQTMSALLETEDREGLDTRWTITPVGGIDKVPTFVALIGSQSGLTIATLTDIKESDRQTIENLYKRKLLDKNNVFTFGDFTKKTDADVEDMFDIDFYLKLVNAEFKGSLKKEIKQKDLDNKLPTILNQIETYLEKEPMKKGVKLNHYRPARYLAENSSALRSDIGDQILDRFEELFKNLNAIL